MSLAATTASGPAAREDPVVVGVHETGSEGRGNWLTNLFGRAGIVRALI